MRIGNFIGIKDLRGKLLGSEDWYRRELSDLGPGAMLKWLVVHHTAGADRDFSALEIAEYHVNTLGWRGIGYHFLLHQTGRVDYVGDIMTIRANVALQNPSVIGVCLTGDFTYHAPPPKQLRATRRLLQNLQYALGWHVPIKCHREIALPGHGTSCPGDTWESWMKYLRGPV